MSPASRVFSLIPVNIVREGRGQRGPGVFRLVELILTFMKGETVLITAKRK